MIERRAAEQRAQPGAVDDRAEARRRRRPSTTSTIAPATANHTAQKCETPRSNGISHSPHVEIVRSTAEWKLTIDELARETGMTVRNIRSHATRGLLPPPEVRARTGYYGPEHVARLKLILELQANGHNLAGIKHLLSRTQASTPRTSSASRAPCSRRTSPSPPRSSTRRSSPSASAS